MPFGDGTGPRGMGPMTGRGAGFCTGFGAPGFTNPIPGRGFGVSRGNPYTYPYAGYGYAPWQRGIGWGRSGGRGRGRSRFWSNPTAYGYPWY
jgi:hypothetical protein